MSIPRCVQGVVWMIAASAIPCLAQTTTTGLVEGLVRNAVGQPLEGVQVRLVSSQVTRTAITNTEGRFHVGLLNPGAWAVTVAKVGYDTQTSHLSVAPEETVSLRFRMAPVASATVEVTGSSTTLSLDPTSTSAGMTLTRDDIERLPTGRNMNDLIYLSPSAGFAGTPYNSTARGVDYSVSGASGNENQFITDGLVTTDLRFGGQGLSLVPEFVESFQVETSGFKPENNALGGVINTVLKSGSNTFRGDAWATWSPSGLEAKAKSSAAGFRQPAPADRYDLGFDAGGAFVKDRLFYFAGLDLDKRSQTPYPNNSGLQGDKKSTGTMQTVLKVNGYLTPEQQITVTWTATRQKDRQPRAYPDAYGDANLGYERTFDSRHLSLSYEQSFGSTFLLSLKGGLSRIEDEQRPADTVNPYIDDAHWFSGGGGGVQPGLAGYNFGRGGFGGYNHAWIHTSQFKADLTWFLGPHAVKAGASHIESRYWSKVSFSGTDGATWSIPEDAATVASATIGSLQGGEVKSCYQAFYVQDTWELSRQFRLIFGLRGERQVHWDAEGRTRLQFTDLGRYLQPRFGFTWDTGGDGRTLLTGSYAEYYEQIPQVLISRAWGNEVFNFSTYELTSYSPTGLGSFDRSNPIFSSIIPSNALVVANGIHLPKRQEWTLGLEKTLPQGLTFTTSGVFRHLTDAMEDSILYDRNGQPLLSTAQGFLVDLLWNPGPSTTLVAPPGTLDRNGNPIGGQTITISDTLFPKAWNKYAAVTVGLNQRTPVSFWSAAYTWGHLWGSYEGLSTPDRGVGMAIDANYGPGFDAWPYVGTGDLGMDRRHSFKLFGSRRWVFPRFMLTIGGRWTWQSGLALSLQDDGSTTLGLPPGTLGANNPLDPLGAGALTFDHGLAGNHGRGPTVSVADLHLDLEFQAGKVKLLPALDIFNLFNSRTGTAIFQYATKWYTGEADRRYGEAKEWLQGRRVQISLKARF